MLVAGLEEVGETALALEPVDERLLLFGLVVDLPDAVFHFEDRPEAAVDGVLGDVD